MPSISVVIPALDDAEMLAHCLTDLAAQLRPADEIVVVDSHSTDATVEHARRFTPHIDVRDWAGYGAQKNYAADRASHDWILSIDADERVTPELAAEIREVMKNGPVVSTTTKSLGSGVTALGIAVLNVS